MSDNIKGLVYQGSKPYVGDGVYAAANMSRRGELVVPDWITQLSIEGRVFTFNNPTPGTAVAAGTTSYAATTPAFLVDVPTGTTIIPIRVQLKQGGTVAGAVTTVLMQTDNKLRYSSGGTAQTVLNFRSDAVFATSCTAYSGGSAITAAAAGAPRTFWASLMSPDVTPTADVAFPGFENCVDWSAQREVPPVVVGPGSFLIHAYAGTTAPSYFYSIAWIEMPSVMVI